MKERQDLSVLETPIEERRILEGMVGDITEDVGRDDNG
jgi:hypothetical protein